MGINAALFECIKPDLSYYGMVPWDIQSFLTVPKEFLDRQSEAIDVIEQILTSHGKGELLRYVAQLAKVEHGIQQLEPWVRDHVVHALLSYLLGALIDTRMLQPARHHLTPFQWQLSGLLHDVGYPVQVAKDILRPFGDQLNSIKRGLGVDRPDVTFSIVPTGLDSLSHGRRSLHLIQNWIDSWQLKIDAVAEYQRMIASGEVCHGMISGLSVLYVIDLMYHRYNRDMKYESINGPPGIDWNQRHFDEDVVPACAAIFVHNLPFRCFAAARIDRVHSPLAYLLRLSDCLQDWDRPSAKEPHGISGDLFDISVTADRLVFTVRDPDRKTKIQQNIAASLVADDVEVR